MNFVKVIAENGNEVAVNIDRVLYVSPAQNGSVLCFNVPIAKATGETPLKSLRLQTSVGEFMRLVSKNNVSS